MGKFSVDLGLTVDKYCDIHYKSTKNYLIAECPIWQGIKLRPCVKILVEHRKKTESFRIIDLAQGKPSQENKNPFPSGYKGFKDFKRR